MNDEVGVPRHPSAMNGLQHRSGRTLTIPRRADGRSAPLSYGQERLWFLHALAPESPVYNVYRAWRLRGSLNIEAMRAAVQAVAARHEVLQSRIQEADGRLRQVVVASCKDPLSIIDLEHVSPAEREAQALRLTMEEAKSPFDLSRGGLFRPTLLRLNDQDHVLMLSLHHVVSDGWSIGVMHRELRDLYEALSSGTPPALPDLPVQYGDYAQWQREGSPSAALEEQLAYWHRQLAQLPVLELPTDKPRPARAGYRGEREQFSIDGVLSHQLKALCQRERVTLFMLLLAASKVVLSRYAGQEDVAVGTPVHNRRYVELEPLIGMFVNTLVLRTDLSGNPSFRELLHRVRRVCLDAFVYQDVPFELLVEELKPRRDPARNPLFQAAFVFQNTPDQSPSFQGLVTTPFGVGSICPFAFHNGTSKFDLTISMVEDDGCIKGILEYSTDLFERQRIRRMIGHLQVVLEGIVADPDRRIGHLPVLTEMELDQCLVEWNATALAYPRDHSIATVFESQVRQSPDAVAIESDACAWTYDALNRHANQLARHLLRMGLDRGAAVGLYLDRSLEMVVALLAVLKAGGTYVPLDPNAPEERLCRIIEDAKVTVVLTRGRAGSNIPAACARVLRLDSIDGALEQEEEGDLPVQAAGCDLAYVMYTSGSTGQPKGVGIPHRGVVRLAKANPCAELASDDVILQYAPLGFDAATFEIWGCLLNGARLVVPSRLSYSLSELGDLIRRTGVTTLWLTAPLFHQMVDTTLEAFSGVTQLLTGGDVVSPAHATRFLQHHPSCRLVNGYGPTENTTFSCCYHVSAVEDIRESVSIGRPIANTQAYILDRRLQVVPIGVAGELCLAGDGLAYYYQNAPEVTAEKFVPHPYSRTPGARLYRSGDRAKYSPSGDIEFLGRRDRQVKIRGFRIELGEIEAALGRHPSILQVAVLCDEDQGDGRRLIAYVVARPGHAPIAKELRAFLKRTLPEYMIPSAYVLVDHLPLTPNGKVDQRALAALTQGQGTRAHLLQPCTPLQQQVARIWAEVLGREQVGLHEDFFELGGHSLLATRVVARLRDELKVDVPLSVMFEHPTVHELSTVLASPTTDHPPRSPILR